MKMKRKALSLLLAAAICCIMLGGCGNGTDKKEEKAPEEETQKEETNKEDAGVKKDKEVLEFYHGFFQEESEWPAAKVMRDLYDEFAAMHSDGNVEFKPIAVEDRDGIVSAEVAGGKFPDIVDVGGAGVPRAAIEQKLVYDLKPYIDENKLQDAVGINYTQHNIDGHIYSVHDQLESLGLWYNKDVFEKIGTSAEEALAGWDSFGEAMDKVNSLGDGYYGYVAGQPSSYAMNAMLASTEKGYQMVQSEMTEDTINSEEFANAFKATAKSDQANGSAHTVDKVGKLMADFNVNGKVGILFNGVWNAGSIDPSQAEAVAPALYPGNIAIASAGGGITVANGMSEEKTKLALEFVKYMTSKEVQEKIFVGVQAKPCNELVDVNALAKGSDDMTLVRLAEACSQITNADTVTIGMRFSWGNDVNSAIVNALMECAISGADIDARFEQLQKELIALIG